MQPPIQPPRQPEPQSQQSQQFPAWAQYRQPNQPPTPQPSWFARQIALSEQQVRRWSQQLSVPAAALWSLILVVVLCAGSFWAIEGGSALAKLSSSPVATDPAGTQAGAVTQPTIPPTQMPAANPVATSTPARPAPTATPDLTVLLVSGNGSKSTAAFTVKNTWQVSWNCTGDIYIEFYNARTNDYADDGPIDFDCSSSNGDSSIYHDSGSFYFNVISGGTWNITVTDLPN